MRADDPNLRLGVVRVDPQDQLHGKRRRETVDVARLVQFRSRRDDGCSWALTPGSRREVRRKPRRGDRSSVLLPYELNPPPRRWSRACAWLKRSQLRGLMKPLPRISFDFLRSRSRVVTFACSDATLKSDSAVYSLGTGVSSMSPRYRILVLWVACFDRFQWQSGGGSPHGCRGNVESRFGKNT